MTPAYKVSYFELTALGEPVRFLLSYGELDFEDNRVPKEKWLALKSTMPYGQMPILEYKGKIAHQSLAICRYLAKQVKLVGKDDWEDLEIDATVDTVHDLRANLVRYQYETDPKKKASIGETLFKQTLPFYLERLDAQAKKNKGYLAVDHLSWADMFFVALLDYMDFIAKKDLVADWPNLKEVKERVLSIPTIKSWVEKRPKNADLYQFFANLH